MQHSSDQIGYKLFTKLKFISRELFRYRCYKNIINNHTSSDFNIQLTVTGYVYQTLQTANWTLQRFFVMGLVQDLVVSPCQEPPVSIHFQFALFLVLHRSKSFVSFLPSVFQVVFNWMFPSTAVYSPFSLHDHYSPILIG